jgi:hypothetical protein
MNTFSAKRLPVWARAFAFGAVMAAALGTIGPVAQASAQASVSPRTARAVPGLVTDGRPATANNGQECFYVTPDCSSTDPTVQATVGSDGDTSACTFQYTVDWGDGNSSTQTFPGGPDGSIEATFTHTYDDKPASYDVTMTGSVLVNPDNQCVANNADLVFDLTPEVGLAALRFAAPDATALTTPGLPVIKDDGPALQYDRKTQPKKGCDGVSDPAGYDYLSCGSPVPQAGLQDKDWPVIFVAGSPLTISKAVFLATGKLTDPQLSAQASVRCDSGAFSFPVLDDRAMTEQKTATGYQLAAIKLAFTGANLPAGPGQCALYIAWTITEPSTGATITPDSEFHILYLTAAAYNAPGGIQSDQVEEPYESLVQIGSIAAAGKSGEKAVFDAIWTKFASRAIAHPILDPASGQVTYGPTFKYYGDQWTKIEDFFNDDPGICPDFTAMLADDSGHCDNFAAFLTGMLAFQGISSNAIKLARIGAFNAGPDPAKGYSPFTYSYMLVGPGLWSFGGKKAGGNFPYRDDLTVRGRHVTISGTGVRYKSAKPVAQGPVTNPPMMFQDGDHAIVNVLFAGSASASVVDPSYGNPADTTPYSDFARYEKTAIAGFAVIYKTVTKNGKTTTKPVSNAADVATACAPASGERVTCYFQAVPYK